jgi:hypothetical protein
MITGTGVHDRPESAFTIDWNECSRSTGIGVHDPPERAIFTTRSGLPERKPLFVRCGFIYFGLSNSLMTGLREASVNANGSMRMRQLR